MMMNVLWPTSVVSFWLPMCVLTQLSLYVKDVNEPTSPKIYFHGDTLDVFVRLVDDSDVSETRTQQLLQQYGTDNLQMSTTLQNSSWEYHLPVLKMENNSIWWHFSLKRNEITNPESEWLPKEEWLFTMNVAVGNQAVSQAVAILDTSTEPILQWSLGVQINTPVIDTSVTVGQIITQSPCSADVAIISPKLNQSKNSLYLGVTKSAFKSDVTWFSLTPADLCGSASSCTTVQLVSMKLTNDHLVLMTNEGLFLSPDLRNVGASIKRGTRVYFTKALSLKTSCDQLESSRLSYTPHCHYRQHEEDFRGDILIMSYKCQNGVTDVKYSHGHFTEWSSVQPVTSSWSRVFDAVHNSHTDSLVILFRDNSDGLATETRHLEATSNHLKDEAVFPAHQFPSGTDVSALLFYPDTHYLFTFGKQIFVSEDGGNQYKSMGALPSNTEVKEVFMVPKQVAFIFLLDNGNVFYGKIGIQRLFLLPEALSTTASVLLDIWGNSLILNLVESSDVTSTVSKLDIETTIQDFQLNGTNPLVLQPFTHKVSYLFEISLNVGDATQFLEGSVGQTFNQRNGMSGVIENVNHTNSCPSVLSMVKLDHVEPFEQETSATSPAVLSDIQLVITDSSTGAATLILSDDSSGGWQSSDVYKTVVLPGTASVLLLQLTSTTHMDGVAVVPSVQGTTRTAGNWFMVNLGLLTSAGDAAWYLTEGVCPYSVEPDPTLGQRSTLVMDMADTFSINFTAKPTSGSFVSELPLMYPTYSNPWLLLSRSSLQRSQSPAADILHVNLQTRTTTKAVTALRVLSPISSLLCSKPMWTVLVATGCPSRKRLVFWYPETISTQDYLNGQPVDSDGRNLLVELEINYRPPSDYGTSIPTSEHVYNADPSKPRPNNRFNISKESGVLKQCAGKTSSADCACTAEIRLSADARFSDCRQKVYRLSYPGELTVNLTLITQNGTELPLSDRYAVILKEINDRTVTFTDGSPSDLVVSLRASNQFNYTIYDPQQVTINMDGSGLYHFRAEVLPGITFCPLYAEFQVYIDSTPIPYPVMFIINLSTAFVLGGVFFIAYLYDLSKNHKHRVRAVGERCPDIGDTQRTGKHPPSLYLNKMPSEVRIPSRNKENN